MLVFLLEGKGWGIRKVIGTGIKPLIPPRMSPMTSALLLVGGGVGTLGFCGTSFVAGKAVHDGTALLLVGAWTSFGFDGHFVAALDGL